MSVMYVLHFLCFTFMGYLWKQFLNFTLGTLKLQTRSDLVKSKISLIIFCKKVKLKNHKLFSKWLFMGRDISDFHRFNNNFFHIFFFKLIFSSLLCILSKNLCFVLLINSLFIYYLILASLSQLIKIVCFLC